MDNEYNKSTKVDKILLGTFLVIVFLLIFYAILCKYKGTYFGDKVNRDGIFTSISGNTVGVTEAADIYSPNHKSNFDYTIDCDIFDDLCVMIDGHEITKDVTYKDICNWGWKADYCSPKVEVPYICSYTYNDCYMYLAFNEEDKLVSIQTDYPCIVDMPEITIFKLKCKYGNPAVLSQYSEKCFGHNYVDVNGNNVEFLFEDNVFSSLHITFQQ